MNKFLSTTIELWPVERLIPYDRNARTHSDQQIEQMARRIREFGFTNPILVDTRANKLYVKKGLTLLWDADCSVGRGGLLVDKHSGRRWEFVTPRGQFDVRDKIEKPLWRKPDWDEQSFD